MRGHDRKYEKIRKTFGETTPPIGYVHHKLKPAHVRMLFSMDKGDALAKQNQIRGGRVS